MSLAVDHPIALDLGELTAIPIHTWRDHGATDGTYLMRVPAGASGPVETHPFTERIYALEPLTVIVYSVDGEPISFALDASAALTIPPGTRHQVVAPSSRYPTGYIAVLSPDCDHPSLDDVSSAGEAVSS